MKRQIEVIITEHRLYEISGAKTEEEAVEIAKQRADADSPLDLQDTRRNITDAGVVTSDSPG